MTDKILIRKVPPELHFWIEKEREASLLSKNDFVLGVLRREYEGRQQAMLPIFPPAPTVIPAERSNRLPFSFVDLFAGIGGMRLGLERVGGRCRYSCEWDVHAQKTYLEWFGERPAGDIRELDPTTIPDHDLLAAGFPCQPFSIAGVSKKKSLGREHGFLDRTQGTLFFNLAKIIDAKRPAVLLLENVKNLMSHDQGRTWQTIKDTLTDLRYTIHAKVVDAASWVPQHRERLFVVGFDRDVFGENPPFDFPDPPPKGTKTLESILESEPNPKYTLSDHLWKYLQEYADRHRQKGNGFGFGLADRHDVARTLSARYYKDGSEILVRQPRKAPRRLTPAECARLMGFDSDLARWKFGTDRFEIVVSDTQAYRQFGNAVVPAAVEWVAQLITSVLAWQIERTGYLLKRHPAQIT